MKKRRIKACSVASLVTSWPAEPLKTLGIPHQCTRFGTEGSEVQILSPRPIKTAENPMRRLSNLEGFFIVRAIVGGRRVLPAQMGRGERSVATCGYKYLSSTVIPRPSSVHCFGSLSRCRLLGARDEEAAGTACTTARETRPRAPAR